MKILNLTDNSKLYTSNVFLALGTWNTIDDVNTLIDVGSDANIIKKIENINTGLGKKKIDQVIITHSHSDHSAMLPAIKTQFKPMVYAFNSHLKDVDQVLKDGDKLRIGEKQFEVFHITAHSYDSVCLLCEDEGILFSGDTAFPIEFENENLSLENAGVLARLQGKLIKTIYPGHGPPRDFTNKKFQLLKQRHMYLL
jgi:glyoxylase-like metal-dependent hydrolase (beta-lactamase superfamily II)